MFCQSQTFGWPCSGVAEWHVEGSVVKPHNCCELCKRRWLANFSVQVRRLMKVIYVAGKYSGKCEYDVTLNIAAAEAVAAQIWKTRQAAAICPHMNTAHWGNMLTHQEFIDGDLAILERCDAIFMLPGWRDSAGAKLEYAHAIAHKMPTLYNMDDVERYLKNGYYREGSGV